MRYLVRPECLVNEFPFLGIPSCERYLTSGSPWIDRAHSHSPWVKNAVWTSKGCLLHQEVPTGWPSLYRAMPKSLPESVLLALRPRAYSPLMVPSGIWVHRRLGAFVLNSLQFPVVSGFPGVWEPQSHPTTSIPAPCYSSSGETWAGTLYLRLCFASWVLSPAGRWKTQSNWRLSDQVPVKMCCSRDCVAWALLTPPARHAFIRKVLEDAVLLMKTPHGLERLINFPKSS